MALGAALFWGGSGVFAKIIATTGVSQITVICYRALFVSVVTGSFLYFKKKRDFFKLSGGALALYVLLGTFVMANGTGFMMACIYLSIPQTLMITYTYPIITMSASMITTGESPKMIQVFASFVVLFGLYVGFMTGESSSGTISPVGVAWSLISVISLAGQTLISRRMSKSGRAEPLTQLFYAHMFGGIVIVIAKTLFSDWSDIALITPKVFALLQYPALVSALLGYGLLFASLKYIPASLSSLLSTMEIVFALMLSPLLLNIVPPIHEIIGCAIIMGAVSCSILKS